MTQGSGTDHGFDNPTSQSERARLFREQERTINTRSAMTSVLDPSLAGRFAKEAKADFTVGNSPSVEYPRLPEGGPWGSGPQVGDEPPFPEDISYVPPCGEPHEAARAAEIAASVEHSAEAPAAASPQQRQSADADPLPPLLSGSAPTGSSEGQNLAGQSPPTSAPPDVAVATARPFSNSVHPSPPSPPTRTQSDLVPGVAKGGRPQSITRRIG